MKNIQNGLGTAKQNVSMMWLVLSQDLFLQPTVAYN